MKQTTLLKIRRQLLDLKLPFKIKAAVLFGYEKLDAERAMKKAKTVLMISSQFTDEWFSEKDIGK